MQMTNIYIQYNSVLHVGYLYVNVWSFHIIYVWIYSDRLQVCYIYSNQGFNLKEPPAKFHQILMQGLKGVLRVKLFIIGNSGS